MRLSGLQVIRRETRLVKPRVGVCLRAGVIVGGVGYRVLVPRRRTSHDPTARHHAALLGSIIAAFAVGAGVGALCTRLIHHQAAWIPAAALMIVLIAIVTETRRLDRRGDTEP